MRRREWETKPCVNYQINYTYSVKNTAHLYLKSSCSCAGVLHVSVLFSGIIRNGNIRNIIKESIKSYNNYKAIKSYIFFYKIFVLTCRLMV